MCPAISNRQLAGLSPRVGVFRTRTTCRLAKQREVTIPGTGKPQKTGGGRSPRHCSPVRMAATQTVADRRRYSGTAGKGIRNISAVEAGTSGRRRLRSFGPVISEANAGARTARVCRARSDRVRSDRVGGHQPEEFAQPPRRSRPGWPGGLHLRCVPPERRTRFAGGTLSTCNGSYRSSHGSPRTRPSAWWRTRRPGYKSSTDEARGHGSHFSTASNRGLLPRRRWEHLGSATAPLHPGPDTSMIPLDHP